MQSLRVYKNITHRIVRAKVLTTRYYYNSFAPLQPLNCDETLKLFQVTLTLLYIERKWKLICSWISSVNLNAFIPVMLQHNSQTTNILSLLPPQCFSELHSMHGFKINKKDIIAESYAE